MYPPPSFGAYTDLPDIVVLVENALSRDDATKGAAIDLLARNGTVVLMGTVADESIRAAAERVARSVPGVGDVSNQLRVEPSHA